MDDKPTHAYSHLALPLPPSAPAPISKVCGRVFDEGAFIYWVPGCQELKEALVEDASWGSSLEQLLSDTRILDVLLSNSDRCVPAPSPRSSHRRPRQCRLKD